MSAILRKIRVTSSSPVQLGKPFEVELSFINFPPDEASLPTTVKFWCDAAYGVGPSPVAISPPPDADFKIRHDLTLQGPGGKALIRVLAQCDETHSVILEVG